NPLCGSDGCAFVYGPQKGASFVDCKYIEEKLYNYSRVLGSTLCAAVIWTSETTPKRSFSVLPASSSAAKSFMPPNGENAAVAAIPLRKSLRL
ncbi:MAG: glycerate kinase, partial [Victivallales bacterium]|nr:glycerate kinase [Victivallales bacterium]